MNLVSKKYSEREIISDITGYISDNELTKGTALASTSKMAARYNVSQGTIHRAVNKLVKKGLIYRVRGSGTYVASSIVDRKSKIGIMGWQRSLNSPLNKAAFSTFEDTLLHRLEKANFEVELIWKIPYFNDRMMVPKSLERYDLIILSEGMLNPTLASFLTHLNIPVIAIMGEELSTYNFHQVFHDYRLGFMKALNLIKDKGFDNICIASTCCETSLHRAKVLKECVKKLDMNCKEIPEEEKSQIYVDSSLLIISGREKARYFIEHDWKGVIFSLSDFLAFGMLDYFTENNLEVGKDVLLVSYDNFESRGVLAGKEPVLTSITHPLIELADATADLAVRLIKSNESCENLNHIIRVQAHELVIRKSLN